MAREENDRELLEKILAEEIKEDEREAFADMLSTIVSGEFKFFSKRQRAWAEQVIDWYSPSYENLVSTGRVPRGREVEMMFKPGPLKPPVKAPRT